MKDNDFKGESRRQREVRTRDERLLQIAEQVDAGTLKVIRADELTPQQRERYALEASDGR